MESKDYIYECFIRKAFTIEKSFPMDWRKDPAALGNKDRYVVSPIEELKAGISYSMAVYHNCLRNSGKDFFDGDCDAMKQLLKNVINAKTKNEIYESISSYNLLLNKYNDLITGIQDNKN